MASLSLSPFPSRLSALLNNGFVKWVRGSGGRSWSGNVCGQLGGRDEASDSPPPALGWFVWVVFPPSSASSSPTMSAHFELGWDWMEDPRKPTWVVCPSQCPWPQTMQRKECCMWSWKQKAFCFQVGEREEVGERKYKHTNWLNTIHKDTCASPQGTPSPWQKVWPHVLAFPILAQISVWEIRGRSQKDLGFKYFFVASKFVRCYREETVGIAGCPSTRSQNPFSPFSLVTKLWFHLG